MGSFVAGGDRNQVPLLPECLDDFIAESNSAKIIDAFVEELELISLGFLGTMRTTSSMTGTSISTPTTVASAAPECKPNRWIAAATPTQKVRCAD